MKPHGQPITNKCQHDHIPDAGKIVDCSSCGRSCDARMVRLCRVNGPGIEPKQTKPQPATTCCGQAAPVKRPGYVKRVKSVLTAAAKFIGDGAKIRSAEEQAANLAICRQCPLLDTDGICNGCGCDVGAKVQLRLEECPAGKWFADLHNVRPLNGWTRNLMFFIMPVERSPLWRWNLDQLAARSQAFTGKRVLAIAHERRTIVKDVSGLRTVDPEEVLRYCDTIGLNWDDHKVFTNSTKLGEVVGFKWLMEQVANTNANETTAYMHAKGVRHWNDPQAGPLVKRWADWMYRNLLDDPETLKRALERYSVAGAFMRDTPAGKHNYHYSGTFFEARNDDWFSRDWANIRQQYFGTEWYPADIWKRHEAVGLSHSKTVGNGQVGELYRPDEWVKLQPASDIYIGARQQLELAAPDATIIITCGPKYDRWVRDAIASALEQEGQLEIVVVFDCCQPISDIDPRIKVVVTDHGSPQLARRAGLAAASGDVICCLDADNAYEGTTYVVQAVEQLRAATAADSRVAGLIPSITYFNADWTPADKATLTPPAEWDAERFERSNYIDTAAPVWRHALEASWSITASDSYHEDHHMWRQLTAAGWTFSPAPEITLRYRLMPDSRTNGAIPGGYSETYGYHTAPVTLFVPLAGRSWAWPALRDWLADFAASERGPSIRLVLCDTSGDDSFGETIKRDTLSMPFADIRYYRQAVALYGLADLDRATHERAVQVACSQIYNRMAQDATTHLVWILEDDTLPNQPGVDALRVLIDGLFLDVVAVSGVYPDRRSDHLVAWTASDGDKLNNVRPEHVSAFDGDYMPIKGSGFGCLLVRRETLRQIPQAITPGERWYDPRFFNEIARRGLRVQLAKGVTCEHRERPIAIKPTASPRVIAFYLPGFHRDTINDRAWGDGWTEWDNLRRWKPNKPGHTIPRPHASIGEYDLMDYDTRRTQAEMAKDHGVYGFAVYHYWFSGIKALHRPYEQMLNDGQPDLPFHLIWANETWTRQWDGQDKEIIQQQTYGDETEWREHAEYLRPFLEHRNYIRHDGRRVIGLYRPATIPRLSERLAYYREALGDDLHFTAMYGTFPDDQSPTLSEQIDSAILFEPFASRLDTGPSLLPHQRLFHGACPGWDNTPRRGERGVIYTQPTLGEQLDRLTHEDVIYVNAWNEWGEGAVIEPTQQGGFGNLQAIATAYQ